MQALWYTTHCMFDFYVTTWSSPEQAWEIYNTIVNLILIILPRSSRWPLRLLGLASMAAIVPPCSGCLVPCFSDVFVTSVWF